MRALFLKDAETAPAIQTVEDSAAGAADAVVSLRAAGLNHRELWIAKGQYPGMTLPATLGADGAGVVETVGSDGDQALSGQEVVLYPGLGWGDDLRFPSAGFGLLGMPGPGNIAESIAVPADNLFPKPTHLDFAQAAALPLAGLTAWRGLTTKAGLREGEALLITGIGGGVAMQALDFAVAMGARVWVTSSSQETIDLAVQRGAQGGVVYTDEGWAKTLGKAAGPIDVVFDGAPAGGFPAYVRTLAMGARVVVYGSTAGPVFKASAPDIFLRNLSIIGTNVGNQKEFGEMLDFVGQHRLVPLVDRSFAFEEAADALRYLEEGHEAGKVIVAIA
ncbi:MAG: alcohol dehydrogenase [Citromicrobium sp.]|nr:alcohol dehydrogenase [Citromicrobium sp.]MAO95990.1 alcohol dehydrogenase [Citromicrobium sp.]MAS84956.1 alcohol dehydrogenase [Erythrobacteraceae bacterium]MBD76186.1 alcohol dehydrogenase [Citromicrobium sp.]MBT45896.1 alcohol dehydrogenase [Citromicrobium sp.]|tara:strand:+ start:23346 stop:24344 length:999 start_codon:yes stop_codon:yes gene_type:complete